MGQLKIFGNGQCIHITGQCEHFLGSHLDSWKLYRPTGAAGHFVLDWPMQGIPCILIDIDPQCDSTLMIAC